MQSPGSFLSFGSVSLPVVSNRTPVAMDANGFHGSEPLQLLAQGMDQFIRIDLKSMLEKAMQAAGVVEPPFYTVVDCGDLGSKVSIKLDVSSLSTVSGERIRYSVVEGEVFMNQNVAEVCAIKKAFKLLENNHRIKIVDFSSRLSSKIESYKTNQLLSEAISAVDNVLVQWELTLGHFENFGLKLQDMEFSDNVFGPRTPMGMVYGSLSDYLTAIHNNLHLRTKDLRPELVETQADLARYEKKLSDKGHLAVTTGPFHKVVVPSKFMLDYVLKFYGLDYAKYRNGPQPHGIVHSSAIFQFPHMPNFKYGGKLAIPGKAYTSREADEEAAYQALQFIEENFKTRVVDLNYSQRKKALKEQNKLITLLSNTLETGDSVKMMFGELIYATEGQLRVFSFDPSILFSGPLSQGQIDAYRFCCNGLTEVQKHVVKCYAVCAPHFDVLNKLTWKLLVAKTNMQM